MTPNQITFLSLVFALIGSYFYCKNNFYLSIICFIVSYYLDCVDGHYARKYNMTKITHIALLHVSKRQENGFS